MNSNAVFELVVFWHRFRRQSHFLQQFVFFIREVIVTKLVIHAIVTPLGRWHDFLLKPRVNFR